LIQLSIQKLEQLLSEHTQDNAQELDNIAAALKHPFLLKHANGNVKLYVALCLADVFRIYAPDAPFEADDLAVRGFSASPKTVVVPCLAV
jgi:sister chromatid cohesion protein PDS5